MLNKNNIYKYILNIHTYTVMKGVSVGVNINNLRYADDTVLYNMYWILKKSKVKSLVEA